VKKEVDYRAMYIYVCIIYYCINCRGKNGRRGISIGERKRGENEGEREERGEV
jgi:hypothetical protein